MSDVLATTPDCWSPFVFTASIAALTVALRYRYGESKEIRRSRHRVAFALDKKILDIALKKRVLNRHEKSVLEAKVNGEIVDIPTDKSKLSVYQVQNMCEDYPDDDTRTPNVLHRYCSNGQEESEGESSNDYANYFGEDDLVLGNIARSTQYPTSVLSAFLRAGPRSHTYFNGDVTRAAIVTCGGVCPGMNAVIRGLYRTLHDYGCDTVYGVRGGFGGFYSTTNPPVRHFDCTYLIYLSHCAVLKLCKSFYNSNRFHFLW
jgi:hypothetical protein